jgi:hypothetical protein
VSYQIIETNGRLGSVERLCGALGVSVSGYYAWHSRPPSQHQQSDERLVKQIQAVYQLK